MVASTAEEVHSVWLTCVCDQIVCVRARQNAVAVTMRVWPMCIMLLVPRSNNITTLPLKIDDSTNIRMCPPEVSFVDPVLAYPVRGPHVWSIVVSLLDTHVSVRPLVSCTQGESFPLRVTIVPDVLGYLGLFRLYRQLCWGPKWHSSQISALSEDFFTSMKKNGSSSLSPLETIKQSVNVGCPATDGCNFTRILF